MILSHILTRLIVFLAYQSALLTTPLLVIRMLVSLLGFPAWFRTLFTICIILPALYMAYAGRTCTMFQDLLALL
jgi:hypothetical protein